MDIGLSVEVMGRQEEAGWEAGIWIDVRIIPRPYDLSRANNFAPGGEGAGTVPQIQDDDGKNDLIYRHGRMGSLVGGFVTLPYSTRVHKKVKLAEIAIAGRP